MMPKDEPLRQAYRDGAAAEARCAHNGMSKDGRQIYDWVKVCAQQGRSRDRIVQSTATVFTAGWPLRRRLRLAIRLVTRR